MNVINYFQVSDHVAAQQAGMMGGQFIPPVGGKPLPGMVIPNIQQQQQMMMQQQQVSTTTHLISMFVPYTRYEYMIIRASGLKGCGQSTFYKVSPFRSVSE